MTMKVFNEDSLRADIVKVWGEYGAHVEVFDQLLKAARGNKQVDPPEEIRSRIFDPMTRERVLRENV